ncbi:uncharacterized protein LOC124128420 [Haliotis rufescens]|uniref:uncharacterized protein LOC124128420 n=1 Tax=Haliotis rufescens TaxID=6454 RepID=UPI00201F3E3C|nr:uncharacterized protein LOC124128420 [Haliotis rufescens]
MYYIHRQADVPKAIYEEPVKKAEVTFRVPPEYVPSSSLAPPKNILSSSTRTCRLPPEFTPSTSRVPTEYIPEFIPSLPKYIPSTPPRTSRVPPECNPSTSRVFPEYLPSSSRVPLVYLPSTSLVPLVYLPSTSLVPLEYIPSTSQVRPEYLPSTSRVSPEFIPSTSRVPPEYIPSSSRVYPEYILSTSRVPPEYIPSISRVHPDASTSRVPPEYIPSPSRVPLEYLPSTSAVRPEYLQSTSRVPPVYLPTADPPDAVASFYEELQGAPKGNDTYEEVKQGRADDPPTTRDARPPVPSRRNLRKSIRLTPVDPKHQVSSEDNTHPPTVPPRHQVSSADNTHLPTVPPRHQVSSADNTYEELNTEHRSQRSLEDQCDSRRPSDTGSNHSGYEMIPDADTLRKLRQRAQKRAQIDNQPKQKRLLFGWMAKKARGKAAKQTDADVSDKTQVRGATVLGGQGHRSEESDVERYRDDVVNTKPDPLYVNKGDGDATQKSQSYIDMSNIVTSGPAYEDMTGDLQGSISGRKKSHRRSPTLGRQRHFRKIAESPGAGCYDNVGPLKTKAEETADYSNTETRSADSRYNEEPMQGEADTSQQGVEEDRVKEASISGRKKSHGRSQTVETHRHIRKIAESPGAGYYDNIGPLKTKAEETADYSNTETRSADSRYNEEPMQGEADTSQQGVEEDRVKEASISGRKKSHRRSQTLERQRHIRKIAESPGAGYYDNLGPLKTKAEETADYSNTETRSADSRYNEEPMQGEADTSQQGVEEDSVKEASISGRKKSHRRSQTLESQRHFRKIAESPGAGCYDNLGPLKTKAEETADYSNTETRSADSRYNEDPMQGEADTSQADNRGVEDDRVKETHLPEGDTTSA